VGGLGDINPLSALRHSGCEVVVIAQAINGECPIWDHRRQVLWWVDMRKPALHAFDPAAGENREWAMPSWVGAIAVVGDGRLVLALRDGLATFDPDRGSLFHLAPAPYDMRRFCFNDGRCDRQGRFIIGPMYHPLAPPPEPREPHRAPIWRYAGAGRLEALPLPPVQISNGLAFSPDGETLYHCDTPAKTIWACDYDTGTGEIANQRVFVHVEEGGDQGGPDGAVVDRDGFYLCAVFGGACLMRFDPDGRLERRIDLPTPYPTMPALGGPDLDTLFVTSASFPIPERDRPAHPVAGALLALEAPAPGLPTSFMNTATEPKP
jgi:sugar lactone lactonase YvrE